MTNEEINLDPTETEPAVEEAEAIRLARLEHLRGTHGALRNMRRSFAHGDYYRFDPAADVDTNVPEEDVSSSISNTARGDAAKTLGNALFPAALNEEVFPEVSDYKTGQQESINLASVDETTSGRGLFGPGASAVSGKDGVKADSAVEPSLTNTEPDHVQTPRISQDKQSLHYTNEKVLPKRHYHPTALSEKRSFISVNPVAPVQSEESDHRKESEYRIPGPNIWAPPK